MRSSVSEPSAMRAHDLKGQATGRTVCSRERLLDTNGVQLRVTEAGDRGAPVVVLAHGFPELAYSWRHQIPALADAGYHVLAPDQRGYGGSAKPPAVEDYDISALTGDIAGLLDDAGAEKATIVGHDWGAIVAWTFPLLYPGRVAAVAGLSVPPVPRSMKPPIATFQRSFGDNFFYILYFQRPGVADAELAREPATTMRRLLSDSASDDAEAAQRMFAPGAEGILDRMSDTGVLPDWISADEFAYYVREFTVNGFTGPLNWYRNMDRNWILTASPAASTITAPALFIGGTADPVRAFMSSAHATEVATGDYREVLIDGAGHWIQQERPGEVNAALLEFLGKLHGK
jgi:pimeloyl-ACP methyl ester carboxylesterase